MIVISNLEEMEKYYNKDTNTYVFAENGCRLNVRFLFGLNLCSNIYAGNVIGTDIDIFNADLLDVTARNIKASILYVDVIKARNVKVENLLATSIVADKISYLGCCMAYSSFRCKSVKGERENSKHFSLDSEIEYIKPHTIMIDNKEIDISEESYNKLKESLLG